MYGLDAHVWSREGVTPHSETIVRDELLHILSLSLGRVTTHSEIEVENYDCWFKYSSLCSLSNFTLGCDSSPP